MDVIISLKTILWKPVKTVAQKMLENHINSHQESELKAILNELNIALIRPKGRKTTRSRYNKRVEKTQKRIEIVSKLLGIPELNLDATSSDDSNPDGFSPDMINVNAVNPDVVNPGAVNPVAAQPDAVNPDAFNSDAVNPEAANPDDGNLNAVQPEAVSQDWTNPALESIH